ncbi:hypothetical protein BS78_03G352600 [Paspalum vaginatum]|nr:hypothetical protein BS78_03G352600 [Paspalum vaginatum]
MRPGGNGGRPVLPYWPMAISVAPIAALSRRLARVWISCFFTDAPTNATLFLLLRMAEKNANRLPQAGNAGQRWIRYASTRVCRQYLFAHCTLLLVLPPYCTTAAGWNIYRPGRLRHGVSAS